VWSSLPRGHRSDLPVGPPPNHAEHRAAAQHGSLPETSAFRTHWSDRCSPTTSDIRGSRRLGRSGATRAVVALIGPDGLARLAPASSGSELFVWKSGHRGQGMDVAGHPKARQALWLRAQTSELHGPCASISKRHRSRWSTAPHNALARQRCARTGDGEVDRLSRWGVSCPTGRRNGSPRSGRSA
jgi:hypothetical protein